MNPVPFGSRKRRGEDLAAATALVRSQRPSHGRTSARTERHATITRVRACLSRVSTAAHFSRGVHRPHVQNPSLMQAATPELLECQGACQPRRPSAVAVTPKLGASTDTIAV
ncbi:hypothetical protein HPB50_003139 [Hyalomma asiaticum]|uniref:Uncharacterized protein n=1 Tax=Hyalomma asiaticum TaxID=266040 RepID=A0ACB7SMA4_HYAAI|nr:hypothetical protein HPB50_003139 [Hyalomma asiaticum]